MASREPVYPNVGGSGLHAPPPRSTRTRRDPVMLMTVASWGGMLFGAVVLVLVG